NDVVPALPTEKSPRCIDGDALFLLLKKRIEQKRILEFLALLPTDRLDLFKLAVRQRSRIGIETPQQCGLPVVHMPDDDDIQIVRWFCIGRCHTHVPECSNGRPARPQVRNNRKRTLWGTLRTVSSRERSWMLVSAFWAYMYPSLRSNSIPRPSSCARPDRSATVVCRNSSMMSSTDFAVDLIAVVQGAQPRLR